MLFEPRVFVLQNGRVGILQLLVPENNIRPRQLLPLDTSLRIVFLHLLVRGYLLTAHCVQRWLAALPQ